MKYYAGIDSGSTYVKVAVMDKDRRLVSFRVRPTGINGKRTAEELLDAVCGDIDIHPSELSLIIATGYGRRMVENLGDNVTEIMAHAAGATWPAHSDYRIRTVIDVGGQDCKVISLGEDGKITNFVMNDKCAAGTGRFLEALARVLQMDVHKLGPLALEARKPCAINSTCVVFAESEVISLLARGKDLSDVVAGIHNSMANRIVRMAKKVGIESDVLLTGGGGCNPGLKWAFENELMMDVYVSQYPQINGAIGAALIAANRQGA